ncbi:hypothetical protein ARMSODRAFT_979734 [Armillaria solidipes]|uniref:Uncharacterized protein n=1 Tax=Armillaria solidipes TaxID=1076256 RepID=A0A2H3BIA5_9AGAR|nr:hypothetical protein ARMSODRAFT_979734 [Armillaria solidipes]
MNDCAADQGDDIEPRAKTWRDFLNDPDPFLHELAREMRDTPANVHACRKYYSRHQETLQEKARMQAHICREQIAKLPEQEQGSVHERACLTQARYHASKRKKLTNKEWNLKGKRN